MKYWVRKGYEILGYDKEMDYLFSPATCNPCDTNLRS